MGTGPATLFSSALIEYDATIVKGDGSIVNFLGERIWGSARAVLARTPVALRDGLAGYTLAFNAGDADRRIAATIDPMPGEVSPENNTFAADLAIAEEPSGFVHALEGDASADQRRD